MVFYSKLGNLSQLESGKACNNNKALSVVIRYQLNKRMESTDLNQVVLKEKFAQIQIQIF